MLRDSARPHFLLGRALTKEGRKERGRKRKREREREIKRER